MSDGSPKNPTRARASCWARVVGSSNRSRVISVVIGPGQIAFTVTPCGDRSSAIDFVSVTTAPFDAQYAAFSDGVSAPTDEMLTMRPQRRSSMLGATALQQRK